MLKMFRSSAPRFTAKDALARKGDVTLIDVREAAEIKASGQAAGALHIPLSLVVMKADPKSPDYAARSAAKALAVQTSAGLECVADDTASAAEQHEREQTVRAAI